MKKAYAYTILAIGLASFSVSGHAKPLDCSRYAHSQSTFDACNTVNETTSSAKKQYQSRFDKILSSKEKQAKAFPPQSTEIQTPAAPQQQDTPAPTETQPVIPTFEYISPERMPAPITPTPNTNTEQQDNNRIKYY